MRAKWFDYYYAHEKNVRLTCRHFDISPQTLYRWNKRYSEKYLESPEECSHRPKRTRKPECSAEMVETIRTLRE
ncbi:MAG: helix-turn-helix domain-containing protein [Dehalococcoidia bacterium]|nr:helix-turn-helix domain-containing protein [Dehalococcoidia bacterium]